jgi:fucose permease
MQTLEFHRDRFTWMAYLFLAFYSYFLNILGPITPFLKDELKLSYTVSSLHFTAFAVGMLLAGLFGHLVIQRLGRWRSLWVGAAGISVGALLLLAGRSPIITIGAAFAMGAVGSLILTIVPSALADQHGEQRTVALSEANVIAAIVSTSAPLLVGWFASLAGNWRLALGIAALAPLGLWLGRGNARPPQKTASQVQDERLAHNKSKLPVLYWVYWVGIVLAVSVEFCMISWSADYLENSLGMAKVNAAQAVGLFLAGMIAGRWAGSRLVQRLSSFTVVVLSILLAAAGFLAFWLTGILPIGLAGLFITGLGVANLYPLILSLAIGAAGPNTVQASTRAALASGTAILALPLALGRLADAAGIRLAYGLVAILLVAIFIIIQTTRPKRNEIALPE